MAQTLAQLIKGVNLASAPANSFTIDSSGRCGIGSTSIDSSAKLAVSNGGAEGLEFQPGVASGVCGIVSYNRSGSAYTSIRSDAADHRYLISGSEKARLDSSGRWLLGTSTAYVGYGASSDNKLQIAGTAYSNAAMSAFVFANTPYGGYINLGLSRNSTIGSHTVVQNGDGLGAITFNGSDGTTFKEAAYISAYVDGTPGTNDMPTRLVFATTSDGASSSTERMRITNDGKVFIGTTSAGSFATVLTLKGSTTWSVGPGISSGTTFYVVNGGGTGVYVSDGATSWTGLSDERLKTDLKPITSGLDKISSLRAVTGRYISDTEDASRSFLIAQDVQTVLPEAVDSSNPDELGLRYTEIIPLLVAALKESKERIEQLEAEMAEVKTQLA